MDPNDVDDPRHPDHLHPQHALRRQREAADRAARARELQAAAEAAFADAEGAAERLRRQLQQEREAELLEQQQQPVEMQQGDDVNDQGNLNVNPQQQGNPQPQVNPQQQVNPPPPPPQPQPPVMMDAAGLNRLIAAVGAAGGGGGGRKLQTLSSTSGSEWLTWRTHFSAVAQINNWNDQRRRRELKAAMLGDASRLTGDINVEPIIPAGGAAYTIENALTAYAERFLPPAASKVARVEFHNATQRPDETVAQFHGRLREAYFRAYPNDPDPNQSVLLIQQYALGLADAVVCQFVMDRDPQTYIEASNIAQMKSATEAAMRKRPAGKGGINNVGTVTGTPKSDVECWACGNKGHIRADCRSKPAATTTAGGSGGGGGRGRNRRRRGRGGGGGGGNRKVGQLGEESATEKGEDNADDASQAKNA